MTTHLGLKRELRFELLECSGGRVGLSLDLPRESLALLLQLLREATLEAFDLAGARLLDRLRDRFLGEPQQPRGERCQHPAPSRDRRNPRGQVAHLGLVRRRTRRPCKIRL